MVLDWAEMDGDVVDELILNCSSTFALSMEELLMAELQEQDEALIEVSRQSASALLPACIYTTTQFPCVFAVGLLACLNE